jgi:sporulation protein YlmC with PRC-barrel domain
MNSILKTNFVASLLVLSTGLLLSHVAYAADATDAITSSETQQAAAKPSRDRQVSKLIGSEVRNAQGEALGEIKDLIVDINNERVYYAVLSFGGFLGVGNKLFAYPVEVFRQAADEDKLILNIDKDRTQGSSGL